MKTKRLTTKKLCLLIAVLLLSVATVGVTLAYIFTQTTAVVNTFTPSEVTCKINEEMDGTTKSNVKVTNTGDTTAYIRAAVVVTWQDGSGNILGEAPVVSTAENSGDYTINFNTTKWKYNGGYYYYTGKVEAGATTEEALIESCVASAAAPVDGYTLHVEVIADAIQAEPVDAVEEAWKVTISNGVVTPVPTN